MTDPDVTIGELDRTTKRIEGKLDRLFSDAVLRSEFEARLVIHDRDIRDLKTAQQATQDARRVPWPSVLSSVVALVALLVVLIPLIANG